MQITYTIKNEKDDKEQKEFSFIIDTDKELVELKFSYESIFIERNNLTDFMDRVKTSLN